MTTLYVVDNVMNHVLGVHPFTPPQELYLALGTQATADKYGNWPDELDPSVQLGYQRINLCPMEAFQPLQNAGMQNKYWLIFPRARNYWGTIRQCGVYDAPTGGNLLFFCKLTYEFDVGKGYRAAVPPAGLQFAYFGAQNLVDPNVPIYACGYWIGQQVMKLLFQATSFDAPPIQAALHPNPGKGYAPVDCTGVWSVASGVAHNAAEFDFPVAQSYWTNSHILIQIDDSRWVFSCEDTTPSVNQGDQGYIAGEAITITSTAALE